MSSGPTKNDIMQIFKRLRSVSANKMCYDCGAKNPTWASITYGIFICIDCSGIHRSLGVHLTFIRSTNLDTNWSWQQLRQMQLGGNARASSFFRSHNCSTTDAQQKYNSRAAQLYREKLHQAATQAMRIHGDKLHLDAGNDDEDNPKDQEEDFFSKNSSAFPEGSALDDAPALQKPTEPTSNTMPLLDGAPDVTKAVSGETISKPTSRKPTIGNKKPAGKKPGLGAKKGLGAQKVTKDFADIEREAEMADNILVARKEEAKRAEAKTAEEEAASIASMRLAYQDLGLQQKKKEQALSKMDPKKAEQMERLGMGFGAGSGFGGIQSHSLVSDMGVIKQEDPSSDIRSSNFQTNTKDKFFDDFEVVEKEDLGWGNSSSRIDEICAPSNSNSGKSAWEQDLNENLSKSSSKSSAWDNDFEKPKKTPAPSSSAGTEAVNKFGNAKSISSDMFFGGDGSSERDANLNRFQGSSSISSDMYFNRDGPSMNKSQSYYSGMQAPDMEDVKESVRQGVTKVAGRLSGMASGVMSQIQDKYGY